MKALLYIYIFKILFFYTSIVFVSWQFLQIRLSFLSSMETINSLYGEHEPQHKMPHLRQWCRRRIKNWNGLSQIQQFFDAASGFHTGAINASSSSLSQSSLFLSLFLLFVVVVKVEISMVKLLLLLPLLLRLRIKIIVIRIMMIMIVTMMMHLLHPYGNQMLHQKIVVSVTNRFNF
jgi:hypothetical protein